MLPLVTQVVRAGALITAPNHVQKVAILHAEALAKDHVTPDVTDIQINCFLLVRIAN